MPETIASFTQMFRKLNVSARAELVAQLHQPVSDTQTIQGNTLYDEA